MLPLLVIGALLMATGLIAGKFTPPRPIDARMMVGALMIFSGVAFLVTAVAKIS
jgi:hypothetical protein